MLALTELVLDAVSQGQVITSSQSQRLVEESWNEFPPPTRASNHLSSVWTKAKLPMRHLPKRLSQWGLPYDEQSSRCMFACDLCLKDSALYSFHLFGFLSSWVAAFNFILLLTKLWKTFGFPKCWKPLVCKAGDCKLQQALQLLTPLSLLPDDTETRGLGIQSNATRGEDAVNLSPGISSNPSCQSFKMTEENQYLWPAWPYIITASSDLQHSK